MTDALSSSLSQRSVSGWFQDDGSVQILNRLDIVLRALWQSRSASGARRNSEKLRMRLKLPDTLLIREESEERYKWLFTAKNGRLMKKLNSSVAPNPCAKACAQFSQEAAFGRKSHSSADPAGVLYYEGEKSKLCSIADLELLPLSKVEPHAVALQKFVRPKGGDAKSLLVCRYRFDTSAARAFCSVYRSGRKQAYQELTDYRSSGIQLKASVILKSIQCVAEAIAKRLSTKFCTRVLHMQLHFTVDEQSELWFLDAPGVSLEDPSQRVMQRMPCLPTGGARCAGYFCGYNSDEDEFAKETDLLDEEPVGNEGDNSEQVESKDSLGLPASNQDSPRYFEVERVRELEWRALQEAIKQHSGEATGDEDTSTDPQSPKSQESASNESSVSKDMLSMFDDGIPTQQPPRAKCSRRRFRMAKHKVPRRLINVAKRADTRWMGENLRLWVKRKRASMSSERSIKVNLPVHKQLVRQNEFLEVDWEWTGDIRSVRLEIHQTRPGLQESVSQLCLASNLTNVGCCSVHFPVVDKDWATPPPKEWKLYIKEEVDGEDGAWSCSKPFYVAGQTSETFESVETISSEDARLQVHTGSNDLRVDHIYDTQSDLREDRVCATCYSVYDKLRTFQLVLPGPEAISMSLPKPFPVPRKPTRRISLAKLESLAKPKRPIQNDRETVFVDGQRWGRDFNLRSNTKLRKHRSLPALSSRKKKVPVVDLRGGNQRSTHSRSRHEEDCASPETRGGNMEELVFQDEKTYRMLLHLCASKLDIVESTLRFLDDHEPRILAVATVEHGNLVVRGEITAKPINPRFETLLFSVCKIPELLIAAFDSESSSTWNFDSVGESRLEEIDQFMQIMAKAEPTLCPTLFLVRGIKAVLNSKTTEAVQSWKTAIVEAARTPSCRGKQTTLSGRSSRACGLWSYDAAVAHLFLGKVTEEVDIKRKHLAAAQATFAKLSYKKEQGIAHLLLSQIISQSKSLADAKQDAGAKGSRAWAEQTIGATVRWLKREGLLPEDGSCSWNGNSERAHQIHMEIEDLQVKLAEGSFKSHEMEDFVIRTLDRITKKHTRTNEEREELEQAKTYPADPAASEAEIKGKEDQVLAQECFACCMRKDAKRLRELLQSPGRQLDNLVNANCESLLHVCSKLGWLEGLNICLSVNMNVEVVDVEGNTPLHIASQNKHTTIVNLLIALGADPTRVNIYGNTYNDCSEP